MMEHEPVKKSPVKYVFIISSDQYESTVWKCARSIEIKWLRIAFHEPSEPGDWAGVFHWTQKSEIAKDFITQQKVVCD